MVYPAESPRGKELFLILEERMKEERYDDEFLLLLIEYRELYPKSEHFDIFYGQYAAFFGNWNVALECAERAYKKRKLCPRVWHLLADCYLALGQPEKAIPFQAYLFRLYKKPFSVTMDVGHIGKYLGALTLAISGSSTAPFYEMKAVHHQGTLDFEKSGVFSGEFLPLPEDSEGYAYWVGAYNELTFKGIRGVLLSNERTLREFIDAYGADFVFDVIKSKIMTEMVIDPKETPVILPIAATTEGATSTAGTCIESAVRKQWVSFQTKEFSHGAWLGQWEYAFFRVDQRTCISSEKPLSFGKPIPLRHSAKRKKLAINILLDALNWTGFSQENFRLVPRMKKFFSHGVIFREYFSVAEYTYPSISTIETGMYPHRSQMFHPSSSVLLDEEYIPLSQRMRDLGYYCVSVMGAGESIYNGVMRGHDRILMNVYDLSSYRGVERTIRQLDAFSECDQFLFLHLTDTHCGTVVRHPTSLETQTKTPLKDREELNDAPSVFLPSSPLYRRINRDGLRRADRHLGLLFDYILEHYNENEYIVQLYSDHGNPFYDENINLVGDGQTHGVYMLRGDGVPHLGMVDELVSSVDIYPTWGKLAGFPVGDWVDGNLPAVFGGKEREWVYSSSLFPGQTYKLAIRTKEYECCMKSKDPVDDDGTVDLSGAEMSICRRDASHRPVKDPAIEEYFLRLARDYGESVNHGGRQWSTLKDARK